MNSIYLVFQDYLMNFNLVKVYADKGVAIQRAKDEMTKFKDENKEYAWPQDCEFSVYEHALNDQGAYDFVQEVFSINDD